MGGGRDTQPLHHEAVKELIAGDIFSNIPVDHASLIRHIGIHHYYKAYHEEKDTVESTLHLPLILTLEYSMLTGLHTDQ